MEKNKELRVFAEEIRVETIKELAHLGFGHVGGSMSVVETLAVLYGSQMNYDPKNPTMEQRDRLVMSKGHAGPALYATLALKGFFPLERLKTLNQNGTTLPSHCDRLKTPGVDMTTGSLGQGTSAAVGIALGDRLKGRDSRTYLLVGDGESDEGQVWEAAMFTAAKKITNLIWLVDDNKKQLDGYTQDVLPIFDLEAKFAAFGFDARRVDGNDIAQVYDALTAPIGDKPRAIILDTVKGKGIREVEETMGNHSMTVAADVCDKWLAGLRGELAGLE